MNQLIWKGSNFENTASICNYYASKLATKNSELKILRKNWKEKKKVKEKERSKEKE